MANIIYNLVGIGWGHPGDMAQPISHASPLPVGGKQESFALVNANAAAGAVTVFGGDYIFAQMASAYGTVELQILGPDGATWMDLIRKTASDSDGAGTGLAIANNSQLRVVLTGTTAAFATLKRVP